MKEQIFSDVCDKAKEVSGLDIRYTKSRKREFVSVKCAIVNVLHKYYGLKLVQIGGLIGFHHTTVIHHLKDHPSRYRFDDEYAQVFDKLSRHAMSTTEILSVDKMMNLMKSALTI
jgi:hypothetical protein